MSTRESSPLAAGLPRSDAPSADDAPERHVRFAEPLSVEAPAPNGMLESRSSSQELWGGAAGADLRRSWAAADPPMRAMLGGCAAAALVLAVLLVFALLGSPGLAQQEVHVTFLAVGDWGRMGLFNQSRVAALMGRVADTLKPSFVVATGDNFYFSGLNGTDDPLFRASFTDVYAAPSLQVPWHAVLGNHDYGDGLDALGYHAPFEDEPECPDMPVGYGKRSVVHELDYALTRLDRRWHCERSYTERFADGRVQLFFIDTSPFISALLDEPWAGLPSGLRQQSWRAQLLELERRLAESAAAWKIVVGHHPPRSSGYHGSNPELQARLEPLMARYGVQLYVSGHDHDLEHLRPAAAPGGGRTPHYVVNGAGSCTVRGFPNGTLPESAWAYAYSGFVAVTVGEDALEVDFYTLEGDARPAHVTRIPRR